MEKETAAFLDRYFDVGTAHCVFPMPVVSINKRSCGARLMISKTWRRTTAIILLFGAGMQPIQAQAQADLFFGIAKEIVRQGVQNDQIRREQSRQVQQQQAAEQAARAAQQAYELEFYTRAQTALKALGFYAMTVDGKPGPGTRAAIVAYQAAFRLPGVFGEDQLYDLEMRASEGWRSLDELEMAETGGFESRADFAKAREGGFTNARSYQVAREKGFTKASDYEAFLSSGAPDKATFDANRARLAAAEAAVGACFSNTQSRKWGEALSSCYAASVAKPAEASVKLALEAALAGAREDLAVGKKQLAEKRAQLAKLLEGSAKPSAAQADNLRAEVNTLADEILFIELHLQAGRCGDLVSREHWEEAVTACASDATIDHLVGARRVEAKALLADIDTHRDAANAGLKTAQAAVAAEAERLALADAKTAASRLLADVEAYGEQGSRFERGLDVAREVVALRGAVDGKDVAIITQHAAALQALLDADGAYTSARQAWIDARKEAEQRAVLEARRQAELLNDFVLAFVSRNVTSAHVPALLPLSEALAAALEDGNAQRLTEAQAKARQALNKMGLENELASFADAYKAPQVSAQQLQTADAEIANADLALETVVAASRELIDSIDSFSEAGGAFADPIGVARALARLKAALAEPALPDLQVLREALASVVEQDPAYASANERRAKTNDTALANSVALATEKLTAINEFLLAHIAANVTADDILAAVELQMTVEKALAGPASAETVRSLKAAEDELVALNLGAAHADFVGRKAARTLVAEADTSTNGLAITPANASLLEGSPDDVIVLRNSAAPHLAYDLLGKLRVDGGVAKLCWLHAAPGNSVALLLARQELGAQGIARADLAQCEHPLLEADLAVLRRGDFLALPPSAAQPLVAAFEDGRLKLIVSIAGGDASRETERLTVDAASIAGRVNNETARGFGVLQLPNGKGGICAAVADMQPHGSSLSKRADSFAFLFADPRFTLPMSTNQAFVAAQRGQCSGLYAAAADLRSLSGALQRADIAFTFAPIWVEASEVDEEIARLAQESSRQQQEAQAAAALLAAKTADQRSALQTRQEELRAEYKSRATGAQKDIADLVREAVRTENLGALTLFPALQEHLRGVVADKWVITDTKDTLADYGTAKWQGRKVEAVLVRIVTERENALLGLHASDCIVLGYLVDPEFRINRDPVEADCADQSLVTQWSIGRGMESVWNLKEAQ